MQKFIIDADQINSLIFSVCGEEVKEEYIQDWLDKFAEKPVKGGGEIISAIAAYLERETGINAIERIEISGVEFNKVIDMRSNTHAGFCQEIATEIAAAIAPLVEAGEPDWKDAPEWAKYRTVDKCGEITFWDEKPRLSDHGYWTIQGTSGTKWEVIGESETWKNSLQQRPK